MRKRRLHGRAALGCAAALLSLALFLPPWLWAQEEAPADRLPDPLTLEYALSLADAPHPALQQAQARVDDARADVAAAEALTGTRVDLEARARWYDPADFSPDTGDDDHKLGLSVRRNLYDFGRSSAALAAARSEVDGQNWRFRETLYERRLRIMERFFEVLLADLQFARENEDMAVVFVALDRLRARAELGQVSDIDLLELESEYQTIRRRRAEAQGQQRATRARLARALNRPRDLPANLASPETVIPAERQIPSYEELVTAVEKGNPTLQALRAHVAAAEKRVAAARATGRPRLNAELEAADYTRELGSYDNWRAGVTLEVPLYSGGAVDAAVAESQADLFGLRAQMEEVEREVRQQTLDLWLGLDTLRIQQEEMLALRDYRELYLDRSRAIYELEVKTDLGDAMVRLTEAQLAAARTRFEIALTWARLDALMGRTPGMWITGDSDAERRPTGNEVGES